MAEVALLKQVSLFEGLSDDQLQILSASLGRQVYRQGMVIFHKDSPGDSLYIIESGKVRIFVLSEAGQEISVNVYGPGEVFGELSVLDGLPRSAGTVALEQTVVHTLHRQDLMRHLNANPQMAWSIIQVLTARLRYTTAYAESLSFLDIYGRVASKLLELADRYGVDGDGIEIDLRLTQAELAAWVSASRESVNKVLGTFRAQGLVEIRGQKIVILDQPGLHRRILY
jgi:CRP/FNR family transcriptional regulator/CRP/FNR family cyclic AMP-dependent transcriptional regulator